MHYSFLYSTIVICIKSTYIITQGNVINFPLNNHKYYKLKGGKSQNNSFLHVPLHFQSMMFFILFLSILLFIWYYFPSDWRIFMDISFNTDMLVMNSFCFLFLKNHFILSSSLKSIFVEYRILYWHFLFQYLKMFHLACTVFHQKSAFNHCSFACNSSFLFVIFKLCLLIFNSVTSRCLSMNVLMFFLLCFL